MVDFDSFEFDEQDAANAEALLEQRLVQDEQPVDINEAEDCVACKL